MITGLTHSDGRRCPACPPRAGAGSALLDLLPSPFPTALEPPLPFTLKPDDAVSVDADSPSYLKEHVDTGDRWVLNFGPQHPATHTTLRLVLELDGERVARCT